MQKKLTRHELEQKIKGLKKEILTANKKLDIVQGKKPKVNVSGIEIAWDTEEGITTFEKMPVAMMWVDTTLAGLMSGVQAMVGTERFWLALQAEGRKSIEADWEIISQFDSFKQGFKAIANIAAVAGWGDWALITMDAKKQQCRFRIKDSWEGRYKKALGVSWGSGMFAGKMAGYCSKLFKTNCWATQTRFIAKGDAYDEFMVKPSRRTIENEVEKLLFTDRATRADMAVALNRLQQEIAVRKHAEGALHESEQLLSSIIETIPDVIYRLDQAGNITFISNAVQQYGYVANELIGRNITEFVHPDDLEEALYRIKERRRGERATKRFEIRLFPQHLAGLHFETIEKSMENERVFLLDAQGIYGPSKDEPGTFLGTQGTARDITDRKKAEEALRSSEAMFRLQFELGNIGIALTSVEKGWLRVNNCLCEMLGYTQEELLQKTWSEMTYPDDLEPDLVQFNRMLAGEIDAYEMDKRFFRKNGSIVNTHLTVSCFRNPNRSVQFVIASLLDITEREQAYEEIKKRTEELGTLNTIGQSISASLSFEATSNAALNGILKSIKPDLVYLFQRDGEKLFLKNAKPDLTCEHLDSIPEHKVGECLCGLAVRNNQPVYSHDIHNDPRCTFEECKQAGMKSFAAIPLRSGNEIFGIIGLASYKERDFEKEIRFLETLASTVATALTNARLFETIQNHAYELERHIAERKRTEEALQESEKRYRFLVENAEFSVFVTSIDARVLFVNQCAADFFGVSLDEVTSLNAYDFWVRSEDRDEFIAELKRNGKVSNYECAVQTKGGNPRWVLFSANTIEYEGIPSIFNIINDITDRKKAEESLRQREATLHSVFSAAPVAIGVLRSDRTFQAVNERVSEILGYNRKELIGNTPQKLYVSEEEYMRVGRELYTDLWQKGTSTTEAEMTHKDGSTVYAMLSAAPLEVNNPSAGAVVTVQDITERRRSEKALQEHQQMINAIVESSQDWIWAIDLSGRHTYSNRAVKKILGYLPEELQGFGLDLVHPEDRATIRLLWPRWIESRQGWNNLVIRWRSKDGTYRYLESTAVPTFGTSGELLGFLGVDRDITERKRSEEEHQRLQEQFQQAQKMEAVGQLAGGVAHDFNNLLQVINGYTELALTDLGQDSAVEEKLKQVREAGKRATNLVSQLLAFSRRQIIKPEYLDLNHVVEVFLDMIRRVIEEHIHINFIRREKSGIIYADRGQIEQVMMNLCVNARDSMPEGGKLTIETGDIFIDNEYCALHPWANTGHFGMISISDTGHGMDKETQKHIFEPFYTTKEVSRGTGLGLATVYGVVKQHNGMIQVYSEPGKGTVFKIYLPVIEQSIEKSHTIPEVKVQGGLETILLAEDDATVRNVTREILKRWGYTVLTAQDGREALRLFHENNLNIQLVITDVVMPDLGGKALYTEIKRECPALPFLFATGYSADAIHTDFVLEEGIELIQKPFAPKDLLYKVRQILDKEAGK